MLHILLFISCCSFSIHPEWLSCLRVFSSLSLSLQRACSLCFRLLSRAKSTCWCPAESLTWVTIWTSPRSAATSRRTLSFSFPWAGRRWSTATSDQSMPRERSDWWTTNFRCEDCLVRSTTVVTFCTDYHISFIFIQASRPALPPASTPSSGPPSICQSNNDTALMTQEDLMVMMANNVAALTSRTSMTVIIAGGVVRSLLRP